MRVKLGELHVTKVGAKTWELTKPFLVTVGLNGHERHFEVPAGFKTDFASVPRAPLVFLLTGDTAHKAAVIHDYLYSMKEGREFADQVFREAMRTERVSGWRRYLMWGAVRLFGGSRYGKR